MSWGATDTAPAKLLHAEVEQIILSSALKRVCQWLDGTAFPATDTWLFRIRNWACFLKFRHGQFWWSTSLYQLIGSWLFSTHFCSVLILVNCERLQKKKLKTFFQLLMQESLRLVFIHSAIQKHIQISNGPWISRSVPVCRRSRDVTTVTNWCMHVWCKKKKHVCTDTPPLTWDKAALGRLTKY